MKIENINVYDLEESLKASQYPMAVNTSDCQGGVTKMVKKLGSSPRGSAHDNFLHGILVAFDLTFSNKAYTELQRYHFIEFVSSQSTMHRISKFDLNEQYNDYVDERIVDIMNELKDAYNETKNKEDYLKLLYSNPSGFQLTARLTTNYGQLKTIYQQRSDHRLPEWRTFCKWILTLPHFTELTGIGEENED